MRRSARRERLRALARQELRAREDRVDVRGECALTRGSTSTASRDAPIPSRSLLDGQRAVSRAGIATHSERTAMALSIPHASAEAHALSARYFDRASPSNRLAARDPSTRHTPRPAPRAELAAVLETVALHGLGASAAAVFTALLSWANAGGIAWPSAESIARRSSRSRRTVFRALAALENAGLVVRRRPSLRARRARRESNTYELAPVVALPQVPRAESPCPPRPRCARPAPRSSRPSPAVEPVRGTPDDAVSSARSSRPSPSSPAVEPVHVEHVARPVTPSPSTSPVVVVAPVPAAAVLSIDPVQVPPWHSKGPGEPETQNGRTGAQARAATAPPGDRLGSPAVAPSSPEVTPTKKLTRAERAAANRAAWSKRTRPASTAARVPAPRRAMPYRAPVERVPDTGPALAALREWQATLPPLGRETDRESATPAPAPGVRRPDLAQRAPVALSGLLEAFARVPLGPHGGQHGETPAPPDGARHLGAGLDRAPEGQRRGATAPSGPRVEAKPPALLCPHPRRW